MIPDPGPCTKKCSRYHLGGRHRITLLGQDGALCPQSSNQFFLDKWRESALAPAYVYPLLPFLEERVDKLGVALILNTTYIMIGIQLLNHAWNHAK